MSAPINETVKRQVVQEWLSGEARDKIAADNNIGAGTVTSIVSNYKVRLETLGFDSIRQLARDQEARIELVRFSFTFQAIQLFYQIGGSRGQDRIIHHKCWYWRCFPRKSH